MIRVFKCILTASMFLGMLSCQEKKTETNQLLKEEVIAIHDEVMPKMGELKSLRKEILEKTAELSQDSIANSDKISELRVLAKEMDDAFEGMFVWMRQFKPSLDELSPEEAEKYLLEQKTMVKKVNTDIKNVLALAKAELENS